MLSENSIIRASRSDTVREMPAMELVQDDGLVPGFVGFGERHGRFGTELPFRHLVICLDHHGDLDKARRRKPHVAVDREGLARIEVPDRDAEGPGKLADHRLQALLDMRRARGGRPGRRSQESGERSGRSEQQQESHGAMLTDAILQAGFEAELSPQP